MPHRRNGKWINPTAELFLGLHDDPHQGLLFDYAGSLEETSTPPEPNGRQLYRCSPMNPQPRRRIDHAP